LLFEVEDLLLVILEIAQSSRRLGTGQIGIECGIGEPIAGGRATEVNTIIDDDDESTQTDTFTLHMPRFAFGTIRWNNSEL
jgi:hypothetical protein